jgi:hypothetical protein
MRWRKCCVSWAIAACTSSTSRTTASEVSESAPRSAGKRSSRNDSTCAAGFELLDYEDEGPRVKEKAYSGKSEPRRRSFNE